MIETILNLLWLGITLVAVWLWRCRWTSARRNGRARSTRQEALAVLCVLALLFPVISLTDDLHPEVIPVEASSSKRHLCVAAAHGSPAGQPLASAHHEMPFTAGVRFEARIGLWESALELNPASVPTQASVQTRSGRAPPSLS